MKIKDIMEKDFVSFHIDDKLERIIKIFAENHIDSAPVFDKDEFIDFVSSLSSSLKAMNVTSFYTSASTSFLGSSATLTEAHISSLFDNIITLRYVEIEGELFTVLNLVKVRGSAHSKGLRPYSISNEGINIQKTLVGYEGIISGITRKVSKSTEELLEEEFVKLLGPMGVSALQEIKEKGLTRENITNYIDSLVEQRIVKPEVGKQLKANVNSILQRIE